jgi:hypothetical protein
MAAVEMRQRHLDDAIGDLVSAWMSKVKRSGLLLSVTLAGSTK